MVESTPELKRIASEIFLEWNEELISEEDKIKQMCIVLSLLDQDLSEFSFRAYLAEIGLDMLDYNVSELVKKYASWFVGTGIIYIRDRYEDSIVGLDDRYFDGMMDEAFKQDIKKDIELFEQAFGHMLDL